MSYTSHILLYHSKDQAWADWLIWQWYQSDKDVKPLLVDSSEHSLSESINQSPIMLVLVSKAWINDIDSVVTCLNKASCTFAFVFVDESDYSHFQVPSYSFYQLNEPESEALCKDIITTFLSSPKKTQPHFPETGDLEEELAQDELVSALLEPDFETDRLEDDLVDPEIDDSPDANFMSPTVKLPKPSETMMQDMSEFLNQKKVSIKTEAPQPDLSTDIVTDYRVSLEKGSLCFDRVPKPSLSQLYFGEEKSDTPYIPRDKPQAVLGRLSMGDALMVYGLPGIGKTRLIRHFVSESSAPFRFCVSGKTRTSLIGGLKNVALALGLDLDHNAQGSEVLISALNTWFNKTSNWVLFIDDVVALEDLKDLIPFSSNGLILLATRSYQEAFPGQAVCLGTMDPRRCDQLHDVLYDDIKSDFQAVVSPLLLDVPQLHIELSAFEYPLELDTESLSDADIRRLYLAFMAESRWFQEMHAFRDELEAIKPELIDLLSLLFWFKPASSYQSAIAAILDVNDPAKLKPFWESLATFGLLEYQDANWQVDPVWSRYHYDMLTLDDTHLESSRFEDDMRALSERFIQAPLLGNEQFLLFYPVWHIWFLSQESQRILLSPWFSRLSARMSDFLYFSEQSEEAKVILNPLLNTSLLSKQTAPIVKRYADICRDERRFDDAVNYYKQSLSFSMDPNRFEDILFASDALIGIIETYLAYSETQATPYLLQLKPLLQHIPKSYQVLRLLGEATVYRMEKNQSYVAGFNLKELQENPAALSWPNLGWGYRLAHMLDNAGELSLAAPFYRWYLSEIRRLNGYHDTQTTRVLQRLLAYAESKHDWKEILDLQERLLGLSSSDLSQFPNKLTWHLAIVNTQLQLKNTTSVATHLQLAKQWTVKLKAPSSLLFTYYRLEGSSFLQKGDANQAKISFFKALTLSDSPAHLATLSIEQLKQRCQLHMSLFQYQQAESLLSLRLERDKEALDILDYISLEYLRARIQKLSGKIDAALSTISQLEHLMFDKHISDTETLVNIYLEKGQCYLYQSDVESAANYFRESGQLAIHAFGSQHIKATLSLFFLGLSLIENQEDLAQKYIVKAWKSHQLLAKGNQAITDILKQHIQVFSKRYASLDSFWREFK